LKLLRVLQEREIRRVGDDKAMKIDVRLVTATNRDLMALIESGDFREDFYYRIHVFEVHLPALRERKEDIPLLADRFIDELSQVHRHDVSGIARDALQQMMDYHWPGNVRELRNAIEHAFVTVSGDSITLFDLPSEIRVPRTDHEDARRDTSRTPEKSTLPDQKPPEKKSFDISDLTTRQQADREKVLAALKETEGNKTAAAKLLGVSRVTMWKKVRKYGID
jgi:two-component system response regulator HydG